MAVLAQSHSARLPKQYFSGRSPQSYIQECNSHEEITLPSEQCRARHGVAGDGGVRIHVDARVGVLVQRCAGGTCGIGGARACYLDVEALRVVLRAVERAGAVQGDDLVAEDVVAGGQRLGHRGCPLAALVDQGLGRPLLGAVVDYEYLF